MGCAKMLVAGAALSACLLPMTSASAKLVIVSPIFNNSTMGFTPFTPSAGMGTILAQDLYEAPGMGTPSSPDECSTAASCTYDFSFSVAGLSTGDMMAVAIAAQAKSGVPAVAQDLSFDIFSGAPGSTGPTPVSSPTFLGASDDTSPTAPVILVNLGDGSYYVQVAPSQVATSGEEISGSLQSTVVPEPVAWTLMLLGVGGIGVAIRSRRFAASPA
jgi:hypothetical protein